jgi:hypothetical protein
MKKLKVRVALLCRPDDIGKVAVFLASDDSYWITGQLNQAAGGLTI